MREAGFYILCSIAFCTALDGMAPSFTSCTEHRFQSFRRNILMVQKAQEEGPVPTLHLVLCVEDLIFRCIILYPYFLSSLRRRDSFELLM